MLTIELIYKKDFVKRENNRLSYSDFTSGDEFSILFLKNNKKLFIYDNINADPEEYDLNNYEYIVINHYIHYSISEMIDIYKEFVNSQRIINSSKKFTINYNEKMGLEKLKDCLNDNWRKNVVEKLYGSINELETQIQQTEINVNSDIDSDVDLNDIEIEEEEENN